MRQTPSSPLRFLAAAHAVMPWAFPGYHDESHAWLSFLDETNVRYYAELRDVSYLLFGGVRIYRRSRQQISRHSCYLPNQWPSQSNDTPTRRLSSYLEDLLPIVGGCVAVRERVRTTVVGAGFG